MVTLRNHAESGSYGYTAGATLIHFLNETTQVEFGLTQVVSVEQCVYNDTITGQKDSVFILSGAYSNSYRFIQVPIGFSYIKALKNWDISFTGGLSINFPATIQAAIPTERRNNFLKVGSKELQPFSLGISAGMNAILPINNTLSLAIGPIAQTNLTSIFKPSFHVAQLPYALGANCSIICKF